MSKKKVGIYLRKKYKKQKILEKSKITKPGVKNKTEHSVSFDSQKSLNTELTKV